MTIGWSALIAILTYGLISGWIAAVRGGIGERRQQKGGIDDTPVGGKEDDARCPQCGGSGMVYLGWGEAECCECKRDWKRECKSAERLIEELESQRAELSLRVKELEALQQSSLDSR